MRRAALLVVVAAALAAAAEPVAVALAPAARADDKEDRKKEERRRERQKRCEAELKAIGSAFAAKNAEAILRRVPKGAKVALVFGREERQCAVDQARGVLDQYFAKFERIAVEFEKSEGGGKVGSFSMTVRKNGEDAELARKLYVTIETSDAGDTFTLVKIDVSA